ncbi:MULTISPECIES: hypothetical protein [unclassified Streptomyces]|nr:hypothetical protein [Streptomyces sp. PsTaAH-130]
MVLREVRADTAGSGERAFKIAGYLAARAALERTARAHSPEAQP